MKPNSHHTAFQCEIRNRRPWARAKRRALPGAAAAAALAILALQGPALAQQYLGVTRVDPVAAKAAATGFEGRTSMWWTSDPVTHQLLGTAGETPRMNRLHAADRFLKEIESRCYGWGGQHGTGTGQCINTDKDGDRWIEIFFCEEEVAAPEGSFYACRGTTTAIGGTGKYRSISGGGTFTEYIQTITPDGMLVGYAPGEINLSW